MGKQQGAAVVCVGGGVPFADAMCFAWSTRLLHQPVLWDDFAPHSGLLRYSVNAALVVTLSVGECCVDAGASCVL